MDRSLLANWLKVPPNPWPPSPHALLDLPEGSADPSQVEQHALERMDHLRHFQLMYPEQVTEGMNLLAQALVALTESTGPPIEELLPLEDAIPIAPLIDVIPLPRPTPVADAPDLIPIPELAEEELIPLPDEEDDEEEEVEPDDEPDLIPSEPLPPPLPRPRPSPELKRRPQREIYAELARLRRVMRVWEALRRLLDDSERTFRLRSESNALIDCLAELRPLLPLVQHRIGKPNEPGGLVAALARQQLNGETIRSLLTSQREALARDAQLAQFILQERYLELRTTIRKRNARGLVRRFGKPLVRTVIDRPEWGFLVMGLAALAIAFARSVPR